MSVELRRPSVTMQLIRYLTHRHPDCGRRCALRVPSCRQALHALTLARIAAGCTLTRRRSCSSACCASSGSLRVPRTL
jgi:hypothetical protein